MSRRALAALLVPLALLTVTLVACGDDDPKAASNNGAANNGDTNNGDPDVGPDDVASNNGEPDTASNNGEPDTPEDTAPEDAAPDATDPWQGRPTGQCTRNADCPDGPNGASCNRAAPGGICLGCGTDDHCPSVAECTQFGACGITCASTDDCPPGLTCGGTGLCAILSCTNGVCPDPLFGCSDSGRCERLPCTPDIACPEATTCVDGLCIEQRSMR